jgi:hypothetical protein
MAAVQGNRVEPQLLVFVHRLVPTPVKVKEPSPGSAADDSNITQPAAVVKTKGPRLSVSGPTCYNAVGRPARPRSICDAFTGGTGTTVRAAEEYLRPDVIQEVARLDLKAKFIVEGFIAGLHDSPYYGFSSEFSEHRRYNVGDDLKNIDWNVFGRTDKLYVKRFEAETNLSCNILLDVSESMEYCYGGAISKLEYSTYMAAAFGYMMVMQQDNVGLITFDDEVTHVAPPRSKRSHLVALLGLLTSAPRHHPTRLVHCLHRAAGMIARRGLVILFSDLVPAEDEELEAVFSGLQHLKYCGHDVVCFHVLDHAEITFPFEGPTRFVDTETLQTLRAEPEAVAASYRGELQGIIEYFRARCRDADIDFCQVDTAESFGRVLLTYLHARQAKF